MAIAKLKKLASKQKQAQGTIPISILGSESCSKKIMKELCILNIYQLNICIVVNLMFKVKYGSEQILLNFR